MKMLANVVIAFLFYLVHTNEAAPLPIRLTIDCGVDNKNILNTATVKIDTLFKTSEEFDVDTFCESIRKVIPKAVKDGKFVLVGRERDQSSQGNILNAVSVPAPRRHPFPKISSKRLDVPRLKLPNFKIPKINVPQLKAPRDFADLIAPTIGDAATFPLSRRYSEDDSSAEKMERFKKGIQKMLHFVKVLGQIDQYLSERTRIVIDKLSKMLAD